MSGTIHPCFKCGVPCCADYGGAPIEPLYCIPCYEQEEEEEDEDE
jgi:hypothetical protein